MFYSLNILFKLCIHFLIVRVSKKKTQELIRNEFNYCIGLHFEASLLYKKPFCTPLYIILYVIGLVCSQYSTHTTQYCKL